MRSKAGENADRSLMSRVAQDEEAAIEELYDRFGSLVYRMAYQTMPTRADTDDAVQEIFVRLWRTSHRYDTTRAALVTWVMLITRRHLVDRLRRAQARVRASSMNDDTLSKQTESVEDLGGLEHDERFAHLIERIEDLPELQKTVIIRAYLGGQTLRQISQELSTPIGTVKSALSRALARLRERVGEETII